MNQSTEAGAARKDGDTTTTTTITVRLCYKHHPQRLQHGPERNKHIDHTKEQDRDNDVRFGVFFFF